MTFLLCLIQIANSYEIEGDSIFFDGSGTLTGSYNNVITTVITSLYVIGYESIANEVFINCISIKFVYLRNVKNIGNYAFYSCSLLVNFYDETESLEMIGDYAFSNCDELIRIDLPLSLKSIGSYAFQACTSLTNVTSPATLSTMTVNSFISCTNIQYTVIIGNTTTLAWPVISDYLFNINPINITFTGSIESISDYCTSMFYPKLQYIELPFSLKILPTFSKFTYLHTINLAKTSLTSLTTSAFSDCSKLTTILFPPTLKTISSKSFYNCISLESISFPPSVTTIDTYAFSSCSKLKNIKINSLISNIGAGAFFDCSSLTSFQYYDSSPPNCNGDIFNNKCPLTNVTVLNTYTNDYFGNRPVTKSLFIITKVYSKTCSLPYKPYTFWHFFLRS